MNEDPNTDKVTRFQIRSDASTIYAHVWRKCPGTDCDLGEVTTPISDADDGVLFFTQTAQSGSITWVLEATLTLLSANRIQADGKTYIQDVPGSEDQFTEFFTKTGT